MLDSRSVQSTGSVYDKCSFDNNKNVSFDQRSNGRKRSLQSTNSEHDVPVKSAPFYDNDLSCTNMTSNESKPTSHTNSLCTLCRACFSCEDEVRDHLSSEHHIYRYMCLLCGCTNDEELILFDHVCSHHSHIFRCCYRGCEYVSGRQAAVFDHLISQHGVSDVRHVTEGSDTDKYYDKQCQFIVLTDMWPSANGDQCAFN